MSKSRAYVFTINNYTVAEYERVCALECEFLCVGEEVAPTTGTPHLQGVIRFKSPRSFNAVRKLLSGHVEVCKDLGSAVRYCQKEGKFFEKGSWQKNGGDSQQERAQKNKRLREESLESLVMDGVINIKEVPQLKKARVILDQEKSPLTVDDVRGVWIWGPPGTGKTHEAREYPDIYLKAQNKWFDGYTGQEQLFLMTWIVVESV